MKSSPKQNVNLPYRTFTALIALIIGSLGLLEVICRTLADPDLPKTTGILILAHKIKPLIIKYVTVREHFLNYFYFYLFLFVVILILAFIGIKRATQVCYDFFKKRSFGEKAKKTEDEIDFVEYPLTPLLIRKMEHCLKRNNESK